MPAPLVTVVVPTRNSARTLEACLLSVRAQTHAAVELLVIDRASTDAARDIAARHADKVLEEGSERSPQRNVGLREAAGEFVVFIDSDMVLAPGVIAACVAAMNADPKSVGVVIPEESFGEGFWAACKRLERSFYVGVAWMEAARFFRTADARAVGGYDESLVSGEDWDISQRIAARGTIVRTGEYIRHDEGRPTLRALLAKKRYYGAKFAAYARKPEHAAAKGAQTGVLRRYALFFANPKKLFADPVLGLGMLFMKTAEFAAAAVGMAFPPKAAVPTVRGQVIALTTAFFPSGGGTETSVDRVSRAYAAKGLHVTVVCPRTDAAKDHAHDATYPLPVVRVLIVGTRKASIATDEPAPLMYGGTSRFGFWEVLTTAVTTLRNCLAYHTAARKTLATGGQAPVTFNCQSIAMVAVATALRPWCLGRRVRVVFINGFVIRKSGSFVADAVIALILRSADACLCVSQVSADALRDEFGVPAHKARRYWTWVDPAVMAATKAAAIARSYADPLRLLYAGRVTEQKGIRVLLSIARRLHETGAPVRLTIAGAAEGPLEKEVREAHGQGWLTFLGPLPKPELWKRYAESDVLVMPSVWEEGMGNVIFEAYASGVPVMGSKRGGIPEALREFEFHRIIDDMSPEVWCASLEDFAARLRAAGRDAVVRSSRATIEEKFTEAGFATFYETSASSEKSTI